MELTGNVDLILQKSRILKSKKFVDRGTHAIFPPLVLQLKHHLKLLHWRYKWVQLNIWLCKYKVNKKFEIEKFILKPL